MFVNPPSSYFSLPPALIHKLVFPPLCISYIPASLSFLTLSPPLPPSQPLPSRTSFTLSLPTPFHESARSPNLAVVPLLFDHHGKHGKRSTRPRLEFRPNSFNCITPDTISHSRLFRRCHHSARSLWGRRGMMVGGRGVLSS